MEAETERRMGTAMTDEERQKLCGTLRWYGDRLEKELSAPMRKAADEIERLACIVCEARKLLGENFEVYDKIKGHAVTQSDAEPVAWRWRYNEPPCGPWTLIDDRFAADRLASRSDIDVEPLYTTLPRPDTSAGLIEAPAAWQEALKQIANQRLTDGATEEEHKDADYVWGYNECVKIARDALHTAPLRADRAAWVANEAADRSGPADYIPIGGAGNGA